MQHARIFSHKHKHITHIRVKHFQQTEQTNIFSVHTTENRQTV